MKEEFALQAIYWLYVYMTLSFECIGIAVIINECYKTIIVQYSNTLVYKNESGVQVMNTIAEFDYK